MGKMYPTDCDWGIETTATSDAVDGILNITWDHGFAIETQDLILLSDGRLKVVTFSDYLDDRPDKILTEYFIRSS